jgi:AcrR family transcriptional regulator
MSTSNRRSSGRAADPGSPTERLPRGPHRLSRDQVAASQRKRLHGALTELLAAGGWQAVKIGTLCSRAGVSRGAFYDHFSDREECLLSAYEDWAAGLVSELTVGVDPGAGWSAFVQTTIDAFLGALAADPVAARAFIVEMDAAGKRARAARRFTLNAFASALAIRHREIRAVDPSLAPVPERVYLAIAFALREITRDELETRDARDLDGIRADLDFIATAIIEGAAAVPAAGDS